VLREGNVIKLKKAITILFVILYLLSVTPLINRQTCVKASQTTWTVDASLGDTIQEAINHASSGATIFVRKGIYYENVVINKSVSLVGEDVDSTIVYGSENGSVISIVASAVNFTGFTVKKSGRGPYDSAIRVERSSGVVITYNKITENTNGIGLFSSSNNVISSNTIFYNEFYGVEFFSSNNNVISGNVISNNYDGVYLSSSGGAVFSGNTITNNKFYGVEFFSSNNNVISGNVISNNYDEGICLTFSSNNIFYHNSFNNTNQVRSGLTNFWNYDGEGNYWSDYNFTGGDLNNDGIGDKPYVINVNNQDNCPLMGMFSGFNISFKGEIYHVGIISNSTISDFGFIIGAETGNRIMLFSVGGEGGTVGFCRVMIPAEFMDYPFIVLVDEEEVISTLLGVSNATYSYLYFTYIHSSHNITIISSVALHFYSELLNQYAKLQGNLHDLNVTYYTLLNNYYTLLNNYSIVARLQMDLYHLNVTYYTLLNNYSILLGNYSQLQRSSSALNSSYQEHLLKYSENVHNLQNLMYIFAGTTAIFIITTIYLSKRAHARITTKSKEFEGE
jgi:parallel beta-helix repeat protein